MERLRGGTFQDFGPQREELVRFFSNCRNEGATNRREHARVREKLRAETNEETSSTENKTNNAQQQKRTTHRKSHRHFVE